MIKLTLRNLWPHFSKSFDLWSSSALYTLVPSTYKQSSFQGSFSSGNLHRYNIYCDNILMLLIRISVFVFLRNTFQAILITNGRNSDVIYQLLARLAEEMAQDSEVARHRYADFCCRWKNS